MRFITPLFSQARLRLTIGYTLFFSVVIVVFSLAFYSAQVRTLRSSQQLPRVISQRMQLEYSPLSPEQHEQIAEELSSRFMVVTEELRNSLLRTVIFLDIVAIAVCIGVSYVLAVFSLRPVEKSYRQQQQFLQDVSHELRTPLAVIQAEIEVSQRHLAKKLKVETASLLASLQEEVQAMTGLVDRILVSARLSYRRHALSSDQAELTDLVPLIKKVLATFQTSAQAQHLTLKPQVKLVAARVGGELELWEQVIKILLDNALKYTPANGQIVLKLSKQGSQFLLQVSDTGQGIAKRDLPHIFERFYRADRSRSTNGSGLGLSIAAQLIREVGGALQVESRLGVGSTFSIRIPKA